MSAERLRDTSRACRWRTRSLQAHANKSRSSAVQSTVSMDAGLDDAENGEKAPLEPLQQVGPTHAQAKPAFRMPDPPKKRPMPPPAPRFSAPAKQMAPSGLDQPLGNTNGSTALTPPTDPGPVGSPESSPATCPDGDRQDIPAAQESKSAKDSVYPATKIGVTTYMPRTIGWHDVVLMNIHDELTGMPHGVSCQNLRRHVLTSNLPWDSCSHAIMRC